MKLLILISAFKDVSHSFFEDGSILETYLFAVTLLTDNIIGKTGSIFEFQLEAFTASYSANSPSPTPTLKTFRGNAGP